MRKILVPVDGSESSLRAVAWTVGLAKRTNDVSICLLHVSGREAGGEQNSDVLARAEELVRRANVPYTKRLLSGSVAPSIAEHAAKLGCEAIVMGTRGMSAIEDLVVGSIANKVVHLTRLPVTLVK